jgi:hypothetical protein
VFKYSDVSVVLEDGEHIFKQIFTFEIGTYSDGGKMFA